MANKFHLNKLTKIIFYTASGLFNFDFNPVPEGSVPVFHENINVWGMTDKASEEGYSAAYYGYCG